MGADSFVVCYGIRYSLGLDADMSDEALAVFEEERDPRMLAAAKVGLKAWWDKETDGGEYVLFVGAMLGHLGIESAMNGGVSDPELAQAMERTRSLLAQAGLEGTPALHFQVFAQY
jgi:hypothetical protein